MASTINYTAHGFVANDPIIFSDLVPSGPEVGITEGRTYYVLAAGLTANSFQFSATAGGAAVTLLQAITDGQIDPAAVYLPEADGVQDPPTVPPTPTAPTLSSAQVSGIVRLIVGLVTSPEAKTRAWEVHITHHFDGSGNPDWSDPGVYPLPQGSTSLSIPALGNTLYAVRLRAQDVFGNFGAFSTAATLTTVIGSDALAAALAALANDVSDGVITETKIADGAISTPKLQAGSVTAQALAATIVLASLIKTANSGRRIEIDVDGIRLYDTDESLLVRIPTNGDPVFVKGQITADSLISQTAATFRTALSIEGNTVATLQNGISAPTTVPTVVASLDSLALGTTPVGTPTGIAYDSGAGTFWIAADPASGFVAHEYNASTGAKVRSIAATGSTSTVTTTLGATSHVSDTAEGLVGSTDSHIATPLTLPSGLTNVKITKVSVYMAGRLGTCSTRNGVWNTSGTLLAESATYTAADGGSTGTGNSIHYDKSLSSPLSVAAGATVWAGFRRMNTTDGSQWDRDDGSGKTTKSADGTTGNGTGWGTHNSASKPNVYITYQYDVDTRLETAPMIGVATDGTYVYTLDTLGQVWKYDRTTGLYVAKSGVQTAITGTKTQAGLFYDATATELIITTTTGTGAGVFPKFVRVTPSTLAVSSTVYSASAGTTFNGATDTFRGGARLADPLNANAATYWIATTSAVYAYTFSGTAATQTSNRDFGQATSSGDGLTHDGTQFWGYDSATPTKLWKFTGWDWTTTSSTLWVAYAWYDSNATGGTHETAMGPRSSLTIRRRERVQVQNATIPVGGTDDPDKARVYMLQNATDTGAGTFWLQVTDALTSRYVTSYTGSGTHDGAGTAFPSGTPGELRSSVATGSGGWSLKGSGLFIPPTGTSFPSSPVTNQQFFRTDLGLEFFYDGTRWLSIALFVTPATTSNLISATSTGNLGPLPADMGGSDIWLDKLHWIAFVNGGTALSASHKWVLTVARLNASNATAATDTINLDSGASSTFRTLTLSIAAAMGSQYMYLLDWTKTGTPGNLRSQVFYTYRIIAT